CGRECATHSLANANRSFVHYDVLGQPVPTAGRSATEGVRHVRGWRTLRQQLMLSWAVMGEYAKASDPHPGVLSRLMINSQIPLRPKLQPRGQCLHLIS